MRIRKGTKRKTASASTSKTPNAEVAKTIGKCPRRVDMSDVRERNDGGSDANEESGDVVERARPSSPTSRLASFQVWRDGVDTWIAKSDAWREKTDDKLRALTDVLLETRELVRSLTRHPDTYQTPPAALDGRAVREEARASTSLDTGNPEEQEDLLAPQVPAPPEIKEDDDDEEGDEVESKRKEDEEGDDEEDDEDCPSPVLAPKLNDAKEEASDSSSPAKPAAGKSSRGTPTTKLAGVSSAQGPVKEEEIRAVLMQRSPLTTTELVATFKARLKSPKDKKAFADILKRISKIQKKSNNQSYVVLRK